MEDHDIYEIDDLDNMFEDDEIDSLTQGFMLGYLEA